jgi:hypothetical protein
VFADTWSKKANFCDQHHIVIGQRLLTVFGRLGVCLKLPDFGSTYVIPKKARPPGAPPGGFAVLWRAMTASDNPTYRAQRERIFDGMRKAGVPDE